MQFVTLVFLVVVTVRLVRRRLDALTRLWVNWRRLFVATVVGLLVVSLLIPELSSNRITHTGYTRFTLFYTHPIATGAFLGLAVVLLVGGLLAAPEPWFRRPWGVAAAVALVAVLGFFLLQTRARGPLLATLTALIVLLLLSDHRLRRGVAVLTGGVLVSLVLFGVFDEQLYSSLVRGQSRDELLSLTGRTELFSHAWNLLQEQPILGYGYLAGRWIFLERFYWAGESHNAFIDMAMSFGAIGLALYALLLLRIVQCLRRSTGGGGAQRLAAEGWALFAFLLVMGMLGEGFAGPVGLDVVAFGVLIALADGLAAVSAEGSEGKPRVAQAHAW